MSQVGTDLPLTQHCYRRFPFQGIWAPAQVPTSNLLI